MILSRVSANHHYAAYSGLENEKVRERINVHRSVLSSRTNESHKAPGLQGQRETNSRETTARHKNQSSYITLTEVCVKWTAWESRAGLPHSVNESCSGFVFLYICTLTIQNAIVYLRCPRTLRCQHTHTPSSAFFGPATAQKLPFIYSEPATDWLFCLGYWSLTNVNMELFLCYWPGLRYLLGSAVLQIGLSWFCYKNWVYHYSLCDTEWAHSCRSSSVSLKSYRCLFLFMRP